MTAETWLADPVLSDAADVAAARAARMAVFDVRRARAPFLALLAAARLPEGSPERSR